MLKRKKLSICFIQLIVIFSSPGKASYSDYTDTDYEVAVTQDISTRRANTLFDDADDLQPQLDNEFKDKLFKKAWLWSTTPYHFPFTFSHSFTPSILIIKQKFYDKPKFNKKKNAKRFGNTIAQRSSGSRDVFDNNHQLSEVKPNISCNSPTAPPTLEWEYSQQKEWNKYYKSCAGSFQSPINLPTNGLINVRANKLIFSHWAVPPNKLTYVNDGQRVYIKGVWDKDEWPSVYGGAAFSRRYLFHSMSFHWPSEHTIEKTSFPLESQLLHISAEYQCFEEAVAASGADPLAFLGIVNIFKVEKRMAKGLEELIRVAAENAVGERRMMLVPLADFSPPFEDYVCYHGSLTTPPCTEAVLWLIRRTSLPVTQDALEDLGNVVRFSKKESNFYSREVQPTNDRKIYLFVQPTDRP